MNLICKLSDPAVWAAFYAYKIEGGHLSRREQTDLEDFIAAEGYLAPAEAIVQGDGFAPPRRRCICKLHSQKKRIVYLYKREENYLLKLLTWLLAERYDGIFADNLYSFRRQYSAKDAIRKLVRSPRIDELWAYKVDIHDYFNSVPIRRLLPLLERTLADEPEIYRFLESLLTDPTVEENGRLIAASKGIMAGTPTSTFLANLYLSEMDHYFAERGILYARYSDDIIVFAESEEMLEEQIAVIARYLQSAGLEVNLAKECRYAPGEQWTFLGIAYQKGTVDVSPVSLEKLKGKMRRKTRALMRWKAKKGAEGIHAAKAFVKAMNRKLYDNDAEHELTWTRWYFPLINTAKSLEEIDRYSGECIRYLATGKRTKGRFNFRYEEMKALGYISLVNRYYRHQSEGAQLSEAQENSL